jgi:hypothetical protein
MRIPAGAAFRLMRWRYLGLTAVVGPNALAFAAVISLSLSPIKVSRVVNDATT